MNKSKKTTIINAIGIVLLVTVLMGLFFLAAGCADNESRNNPLDPKAENYVTPTPAP